MGTNLEKDLNSTIVAAVNARVEAAMLEALSADDVFGQFVSAALQEKVKDGYRDAPYMQVVLKNTIRDAAKEALKRVLEEDAERIEEEVRKAIRRDAPKIAESLIGSLVEKTQSGFGIRMRLEFPEDV